MKTIIENLGFKAEQFEIGIGNVTIYFDETFGVGFSIVSASDNEIHVIHPVIIGLVPDDFIIPKITTTKESFKKDLERIKKDLKTTFHVSKDLTRKEYEKLSSELKIASKCKDNIEYSSNLQSSLMMAANVLGLKNNCIQTMREDGSVALSININLPNGVEVQSYIEIYVHTVLFMTVVDGELVMSHKRKDEFYEFVTSNENIKHVAIPFKNIGDKNACGDFILNEMNKFKSNRKVVATLI